VKIPIHFDTDRECIERALVSLALPELAVPKIVRMANTLSLDKLQVSEGYGPQVAARPGRSHFEKAVIARFPERFLDSFRVADNPSGTGRVGRHVLRGL
jgi:hypothetical protein